jgi:hypothetical protein
MRFLLSLAALVLICGPTLAQYPDEALVGKVDGVTLERTVVYVAGIKVHREACPPLAYDAKHSLGIRLFYGALTASEKIQFKDLASKQYFSNADIFNKLPEKDKIAFCRNLETSMNSILAETIRRNPALFQTTR